jgi:hypothetical protein
VIVQELTNDSKAKERVLKEDEVVMGKVASKVQPWTSKVLLWKNVSNYIKTILEAEHSDAISGYQK